MKRMVVLVVLFSLLVVESTFAVYVNFDDSGQIVQTGKTVTKNLVFRDLGELKTTGFMFWMDFSTAGVQFLQASSPSFQIFQLRCDQSDINNTTVLLVGWAKEGDPLLSDGKITISFQGGEPGVYYACIRDIYFYVPTTGQMYDYRGADPWGIEGLVTVQGRCLNGEDVMAFISTPIVEVMYFLTTKILTPGQAVKVYYTDVKRGGTIARMPAAYAYIEGGNDRSLYLRAGWWKYHVDTSNADLTDAWCIRIEY